MRKETLEKVQELRRQLDVIYKIIEGKGAPSTKLRKLKKEFGIPVPDSKHEVF